MAELLDPAEAAEEASRLGAAVDRLLAGRTCYGPNRKLLAHLGRERDALFTFLVIPEVQATNWRAEHAIRPAVVSRKTWGGNATWKGATTWQVLASVLATAAQQKHDPVALLIGLLRTPGPVVASLNWWTGKPAWSKMPPGRVPRYRRRPTGRPSSRRPWRWRRPASA